MHRSEAKQLAFVAVALVASAALYWPALGGPFLFDDLRNLPMLARDGGVTDWPSFALWTFGGSSGPFGRPLAMASFLVNDYTWPTEAWSFKYTNLLLHLATGLLVFWFLRTLAEAMPPESRQRGQAAATAATILWLIHPLQMATVMFVVQRMTILATAFMLCACIVWLKGRRLTEIQPWRATLVMLGGLALFGLLALLCKEIAISLPVYVAVIAMTIAPLSFRDRRWKAFHWSMLVAVPVAAVVYATLHWQQLAEAFSFRPFTPWQRILSEPLVLWMYLREILLPNLRVGLYFDDLVAVQSLTTDPQAALALCAWALTIAGALALRRRMPVLAFGVLWFVAGHLLEAGPFSLELAFLHRNYLPCLGPIFAICHAATALRARHFAAAALAAIGICCTLTAVNAFTWGNAGLLYTTWAEQRPLSARAQQDAARFWLGLGRLDKTLEFLDRGIAASPRSPALRIERYYLRCINGLDDAESWSRIEDMLPGAEVDTATADAFMILQDEVVDRRCDRVQIGEVREAIVKLMQENPFYSAPDWKRALWSVIAQSQWKLGDRAGAMTSLDAAYAARPGFETALEQANLMQAIGNSREAARYFQKARDTAPGSLGERIYFEQKLKPEIDRRLEALRKMPD